MRSRAQSFRRRSRAGLFPLTLALALGLGGLGLGAPPAFAAPSLRAVAPPGPGLDALEVVLDAATPALKVRRCKTNGCADGGTSRSIPIPIDRSRIDASSAVVEALSIGEGKHVIHARVSDAQRKDLAFEAVLAGNDGEPIFAGLTGYTRGEDGDRSGQAVLVYDRDVGEKIVVIAETREDTRICGQASTPLGARGLDPKSMQLRGATLHRLDKKARDEAVKVTARGPSVPARPSLARVLTATGGSAPGAPALTDGQPETAWSERRPGDGHGEFVTMRAPAEVPIHGFVVTVAPRAPEKGPPSSHSTPAAPPSRKAAAPDSGAGAAPRTFFLATDAKLYQVTIPEDAWHKPGASYEVPLPEPTKTSCLALVLDEAYTRGLTSPEVTIAELSATTRFDADGATMDDVAKELSGARSEEAVAVLKRGGDDALQAVARRWSSLDARARLSAIDVAESAGACDGAAMDLLTRGLADAEAEVKKRSIGRVARCGKAATAGLVVAMRSEDEARRAGVAPLLAALAPGPALEAIGEQLGK